MACLLASGAKPLLECPHKVFASNESKFVWTAHTEGILHLLQTTYTYSVEDTACVFSSLDKRLDQNNEEVGGAPECVAPICPGYAKYLQDHYRRMRKDHKSNESLKVRVERMAGLRGTKQSESKKGKPEETEAFWTMLHNQIFFAANKLRIRLTKEQTNVTRLQKAMNHSVAKQTVDKNAGCLPESAFQRPIDGEQLGDVREGGPPAGTVSIYNRSVWGKGMPEAVQNTSAGSDIAGRLGRPAMRQTEVAPDEGDEGWAPRNGDAGHLSLVAEVIASRTRQSNGDSANRRTQPFKKSTRNGGTARAGFVTTKAKSHVADGEEDNIAVLHPTTASKAADRRQYSSERTAESQLVRDAKRHRRNDRTIGAPSQAPANDGTNERSSMQEGAQARKRSEALALQQGGLTIPQLFDQPPVWHDGVSVNPTPQLPPVPRNLPRTPMPQQSSAVLAHPHTTSPATSRPSAVGIAINTANIQRPARPTRKQPASASERGSVFTLSNNEEARPHLRTTVTKTATPSQAPQRTEGSSLDDGDTIHVASRPSNEQPSGAGLYVTDPAGGGSTTEGIMPRETRAKEIAAASNVQQRTGKKFTAYGPLVDKAYCKTHSEKAFVYKGNKRWQAVMIDDARHSLVDGQTKSFVASASWDRHARRSEASGFQAFL